jgi:hypothetical protein
MNQPEYSDLQVVQAYAHAVATAADMLVKACRERNSDALASMALQLHHMHDLQYLTMLLGELTIRLVAAQEVSHQAHGPLIPTDDSDTPEAWNIAVYDQMNAAMEHDNPQLYASMGVDGMTRATLMDAPEDDEELWQYLVKAMMRLDQGNLVMMAAELMRRAVTQERG